MKTRVTLLLAIAALSAALACDRKHEPAAVATRPADQAAGQTAGQASRPVAQRPATRPVSIITISDQPVTFPPARLVLRQTPAGVTATLFSDDPPEAVKDDYRGNSFRFQMSFEGESIDDVSGQAFVWKNSADDKQDSTTGIFLNGQQQMVLPTTATLTLLKTGDSWSANLAGEFQLIDNAKENALPLTIHAFADMPAELVTADARH